MAIVIRGKTKCHLCGKPIETGQDVVSFPNLTANPSDPLTALSDGAFHGQCFYDHPLARKAQDRYDEILRHNGPGHRVCVVCDKEINDPEEYFTMGHLTSQKTAPAYHYNYVQTHLSCLPNWPERNSAINVIQNLRDSGAWKGNFLDDLLAKLRKAS